VSNIYTPYARFKIDIFFAFRIILITSF
jgi:hypothetical protein